MKQKDPQVEAIEHKRERLKQKLIKRLGGDYPITNDALHNTPEGDRVKRWFHKMTVEAHRALYEKVEAKGRLQK